MRAELSNIFGVRNLQPSVHDFAHNIHEPLLLLFLKDANVTL